MAQEVIVQLVDDLDGSEADETVHFSLDGVDYEIDLSFANAAKLRDPLAEYIPHARRTGGRTRRGTVVRPDGRKDSQAMREWGRENGWEVSDRGRVAKPLEDAYNEAMSSAKPRRRAK